MTSKFCFVSLLLLLCGSGLAIPVSEVPTVNNLPLQSDGHALDSAVPKTGSDRDPDAIVYPDEITRDSYGNAVTPFDGLAETHLDIGHMTDVNAKDEPQLDNRASLNKSSTDQGFVIPSYASGIMKVETLFPNAPVFPLVAPTKNGDKTAAREPIELSNDILPPYKNDEQKIQYPSIEVNTQATIFFPDSAFFHQINGQGNPNNNEDHTKIKTTTTTKAPLNANSGIYTGGFGGSAGVLGSPQPLGFAYANKKQGASIPSSPEVPVQHGSFLDVNLLPPPPPAPSAPSSKPVSIYCRRASRAKKVLLDSISFYKLYSTYLHIQVPPVSHYSPSPSHSSRPVSFHLSAIRHISNARVHCPKPRRNYNIIHTTNLELFPLVPS